MRWLLSGCFGLAALMCSQLAAAAQLSVSMAPVWWQYKEVSGFVPGFGSTPFDSTASGFAMRGSIEGRLDIAELWQLKSSWAGLLPLNSADERWTLGTGVQRNQLKILQSEFRFELLRQAGPVQLGVWTAYQWHQQQRRTFVVNGLAITGIAQAVKETVQTTWAGIAIESDTLDRRLHARLEAALPVRVRVNNTAVADTFHRRRGFRAGGLLRWYMPWQVDDFRLSLDMRYAYRMLGPDKKPTALWPENSWQSVSAGLSMTW